MPLGKLLHFKVSAFNSLCKSVLRNVTVNLV